MEEAKLEMQDFAINYSTNANPDGSLQFGNPNDFRSVPREVSLSTEDVVDEDSRGVVIDLDEMLSKENSYVPQPVSNDGVSEETRNLESSLMCLSPILSSQTPSEDSLSEKIASDVDRFPPGENPDRYEDEYLALFANFVRELSDEFDFDAFLKERAFRGSFIAMQSEGHRMFPPKSANDKTLRLADPNAFREFCSALLNTWLVYLVENNHIMGTEVEEASWEHLDSLSQGTGVPPWCEETDMPDCSFYGSYLMDRLSKNAINYILELHDKSNPVQRMFRAIVEWKLDYGELKIFRSPAFDASSGLFACALTGRFIPDYRKSGNDQTAYLVFPRFQSSEKKFGGAVFSMLFDGFSAMERENIYKFIQVSYNLANMDRAILIQFNQMFLDSQSFQWNSPGISNFARVSAARKAIAYYWATKDGLKQLFDLYSQCVLWVYHIDHILSVFNPTFSPNGTWTYHGHACASPPIAVENLFSSSEDTVLPEGMDVIPEPSDTPPSKNENNHANKDGAPERLSTEAIGGACAAYIMDWMQHTSRLRKRLRIMGPLTGDSKLNDIDDQLSSIERDIPVIVKEMHPSMSNWMQICSHEEIN